MTAIVWDEVGERRYETGVDRGVLYLTDDSGVPWNGLTSVTEKTTGNSESPLYFDGVKYGEHLAIGDFSATLKAYTYPDEFLEFEGIIDVGNGLFVTGQMPKRFGLSYRTKIGNDLEGLDHGYKIHILYNLLATPSPKTFDAISDAQVSEFSWEISAVPGEISGLRPTAHVILDTRFMDPLLISDIERTLYGDSGANPQLPRISTLVSYIGSWVIIRITDNLDGTWTAEGPDDLITMLDATTFQITQANAVYLDADTYVISDRTH